MVDSEDEDVLYDNQLGQTLIGGKKIKNIDDVLNGGRTDKRKLRKTLALCMAFVGLGLCVAVLGPTLLSLKDYFDTILPKASLAFTGRSFGYLCGALLGGLLYDHFNPLFLVGSSLFLCGGGFLLTPLLHSLFLFAIVMGIAGVTMGVLDTGANLFCLRMWGKKGSAPMLQALHFSFAFGAFLAPLLTAPFLAEVPSNSSMITDAPTSAGSRRLLQVDSEVFMLGAETIQNRALLYVNLEAPAHEIDIPDIRIRRGDDGNTDAEPIAKPEPNSTAEPEPKSTAEPEPNSTAEPEPKSTAEPEPKSTATMAPKPPAKAELAPTVPTVPTHLENFLIPYLIIGVFILITSLLFCYFLCTTPKGEPRHSGGDVLEDDSEGKVCTFHTRVMALLFVFYFLYVGAEVSYGGFVAAFAVQSSHQFSQDHAALVVSLFWGTFTLGRGLAICLASVLSPLRMIIADLVGAVAACLALVLLADTYEIALWAGTGLLGLSMASLFPSGIAWLQTYTRITGTAASILVVGSALGEMVMPLLISSLFMLESEHGYMSLMYSMLGISLFCAAIFAYVVHLAAEKGEEKNSLPAKENHAVKIFHDIKTAIPMEEVSLGSHERNGKQMGSTLIPHTLKGKDHKE